MDAVPNGFIDLVDARINADQLDGGVVKDNVQPAIFALSCGDHSFYLGSFGYIRADKDRRAAGGTDLAYGLVTGLLVNIRHHHAGSFLRQPQCSSLSHAHAATGDNGDFVL